MDKQKEQQNYILEWSIPEPNSGCWLWLRSVDTDGYGLFSLNGKTTKAHRFSYEAFISSALGYNVLHSCDTPSCVNPDHLRLGTHKENMQDMVIRGRRFPLNSKLTKDDIESIKIDNRVLREIAKEYNVSICTISKVRTGKSYKPIGQKYN